MGDSTPAISSNGTLKRGSSGIKIDIIRRKRSIMDTMNSLRLVRKEGLLLLIVLISVEKALGSIPEIDK
jgi:hypothetical protein